MNSIRPLATVAVLAVIGIGLYMVINTEEPIPPEEVLDLELEIPQIEDDLADLIEEDSPSPYSDASTTPYAGGELTAPPAWSPPPSDTSSSALPDGQESNPPGGAQPSLPTDPSGEYTAGGQDPFSSQLARQVEDATTPQEVSNPYADGTPTGGRTWGNVPSAGAAEMPAAASPFSVARHAIDQMLRQGNLSQALLMLSEYCGDPQLSAAETDDLDMLLSQLAGTVIYSTEHELEPAYQVQPGETLEAVAARFQVTPELLAKINGVNDPLSVAPGTVLKVVRGPFHAVFEPRGIRLMLDGRYAGRFSTTGSDPGSWPAEAWTVEQKIPGAATAGSTSNVGGKRILLSPANPADGVEGAAILTGNPEPGQAVPAVYVSAADMDDLYDILTVGSLVTVRR